MSWTKTMRAQGAGPLRWAGASFAALALTATACGTNEAAPGPVGASLNVSQGGAQDFAEFRAIVERGDVPSPKVLDEVGFFAEHSIELPPADCGQDLCLHPMLAVAPRFDDGNWTMGFVAMNTSVDPATLPRPPLHLAVAIERSDHTASLADAIVDGLAGLAQGLRAEDRITIIGFSGGTCVQSLAAEPGSVDDELPLCEQYGEVDLYGGLAAAKRALDDVDGFEAKRILLVTSGHADGGITDAENILGLGEGIVKEGIALGIIGMGTDFQSDIVSQLGSMGAGSYSYAVDAEDVSEIMKLEGETALFPLATDFRMRVKAAPGYRIGRIYGAKRAWSSGSEATLDLPALFIGQRAGAAEVGGARRGGGGGLFIELLIDPEAAVGIDAGAPAMTVVAGWNESSGPVSKTLDVINELRPGENPPSNWATFTDPKYSKPFMMLNLYLAFKASVSLYDNGDCARAKGVVDMMRPSIKGWQTQYGDEEIASDHILMMRLQENLEQRCSSQAPIEPATFDGGCMFI